MRAIGIRELRQQASRYLRDVERGEVIEVTDRGRPVARLVPIRAGDALGELATSGRLSAATGDLLDLGPPLEPVQGEVLPSEALARAGRMNADAAAYLDSSALVKLVVAEAESDALTGHLRKRANRVSCALARVEVVRAVASQGHAATARARRLL